MMRINHKLMRTTALSTIMFTMATLPTSIDHPFYFVPQSMRIMSGWFRHGIQTNVWSSINIGGGGFVRGIDVINSTNVVCRTDSTGAFVFDTSSATYWRQMCTGTALNLTSGNGFLAAGCIEVRMAPSNTNIIYMAYTGAGTGVTAATGKIWRSLDNGYNFTLSYSYTATGQDANDAAGQFGQKMAIDPNNSSIVYFGTPQSGVARTIDGGVSWALISSATIPVCTTTRGAGVFPGHPGMCFDPSSGTVTVSGQTRTKTLYIPVYGGGVYQSTDGGVTFSLLDSGPTQVIHGIIGSSGTYYCTNYDASAANTVYKYAGSWTNISSGAGTNGSANSAVAVFPGSDVRIVVANDGSGLKQSSNGGSSYGTAPTQSRSSPEIPWQAVTLENYLTLGQIAFDENGTLWLSEGIGNWLCTDFQGWASPSAIIWVSKTKGIENLIPRAIIVPPGSGNRIYFGGLDRAVFTLTNPTSYPTNHSTSQFSLRVCYDMDYASSNPDYVTYVQAHSVSEFALTAQSSLITDGGPSNWTICSGSPPINGGTRIACSSPTNWVVAIPSQGVYYTADAGATWTGPQSVAGGDTTGWGCYCVCADRVSSSTFYLLNITTHKVYSSTDGGATWSTALNSVNIPNAASVANTRISSVPDHAGHLFICGGGQGPNASHPGNTTLLFSSDGGATWTSLASILEPSAFCVGKVATGGQTYHTLYVAGYVSNVFGVWRSVNFNPASLGTETWTSLGQPPWFPWPSAMAASMDTYNRLYLNSTTDTAFYYTGQ